MNKFQTLIKEEKLVLVDFFATWCGPCQVLAPILQDVKKELGSNITIIKIDVDKNQAIAQQLQIQGVPTLVLYKNGNIVWRQSGVIPKNQLTYTINKFL